MWRTEFEKYEWIWSRIWELGTELKQKVKSRKNDYVFHVVFYVNELTINYYALGNRSQVFSRAISRRKARAVSRRIMRSISRCKAWAVFQRGKGPETRFLSWGMSLRKRIAFASGYPITRFHCALVYALGNVTQLIVRMIRSVIHWPSNEANVGDGGCPERILNWLSWGNRLGKCSTLSGHCKTWS